MPLPVEKRPWRCLATLRSGDVLPPSEAEMQQRQQRNGNSHGISDSNNDSNASAVQHQQNPSRLDQTRPFCRLAATDDRHMSASDDTLALASAAEDLATYRRRREAELATHTAAVAKARSLSAEERWAPITAGWRADERARVADILTTRHARFNVKV